MQTLGGESLIFYKMARTSSEPHTEWASCTVRLYQHICSPRGNAASEAVSIGTAIEKVETKEDKARQGTRTDNHSG